MPPVIYRHVFEMSFASMDVVIKLTEENYDDLAASGCVPLGID